MAKNKPRRHKSNKQTDKQTLKASNSRGSPLTQMVFQGIKRRISKTKSNPNKQRLSKKHEAKTHTTWLSCCYKHFIKC